MPISSQKDVLARLKTGRVDPVYLLVGDDEMGKTPLVEAFDALVPDDMRGFNVQKFYATDSPFDLGKVIAAARTLPFLGGTRVVQLFRAERILKPKKPASDVDVDQEEPDAANASAREDDGGEAQSLAEFATYLEKPSKEACLVLVAADLHRGTRLGRLVLKQATVVEYWGLAASADARSGSGALLDRAERYIRERVAAEHQSIDDEAVARIVAHSGPDLAVLRGDVERVLTYAAERQEITAAEVGAVVAGQVSHDDWAMTNALEAGDLSFALRQLHLMLEGGRSPYQILGQIGWYVRTKLPARAPGRIPEAVRAVFETDLAMKTSRGDPQVLLERLIVELCEGRGGRRPASGPRATPKPRER